MIEALVASEKLGKEAENFVQSELGRYLQGVFQQDQDSAKEELLRLDPWAYKTLVDLQNAVLEIQHKSRIAQGMQEYIAEAIVNGQQSTHQLENQE